MDLYGKIYFPILRRLVFEDGRLLVTPYSFKQLQPSLQLEIKFCNINILIQKNGRLKSPIRFFQLS